jgi:hypothetical protein
MCSPHAPATGASAQANALLAQLQDNLFNTMVLLCRLQDLIAPADRTEKALPQPTEVAPAASATVRPQVCIYEEAITAVLQDAGHPLTFQPIYDGVLARGHHCSRKTVQRYLKKMSRAGWINHDSRGYELTVTSPPCLSSAQPG